MTELLLATEAAESGGGASSSLVIIILIAALAAFAIAYFVVGPGRSGGPSRRGDIPLAMRPYHSDEELETTGMERAMSWGVALSLFAALFLPLYWLVEPARIDDKRDEFYTEDVEQGRRLYASNCTTCHGDNLEGGFASHPDPDVDAPWPAPRLNNIVARYEDSEIVPDVRDMMIQTLRRGRAGTPMPAWGAAFQGPLNDQQIETIVDYILSVQTGEVERPEAEAFVGASGADIFQDNCARCHGQDAEGRVGPNLVNVFERYGWEPGDEGSLREAREAIRSTLLVGRRVPSVGLMPSFEDVLTPDAITAVIDHLESIQETGGPRSGRLGGLPDEEGDQ